MPRLWFFTGIGKRQSPMPHVESSIAGLKDWIEERLGTRPGWPDKINMSHNSDGTVRLVLELEFVLKDVDEIEALTAMAKSELSD